MAQLYGNFSAKTVTETTVNINTSAWTALPTTAQTGRNLIEVFNRGENALYLSTNSSASVKEVFAIGGGDFKAFPLQDNVTLYGRSRTGGTRVIMWEYR